MEALDRLCRFPMWIPDDVLASRYLCLSGEKPVSQWAPDK